MSSIRSIFMFSLISVPVFHLCVLRFDWAMSPRRSTIFNSGFTPLFVTPRELSHSRRGGLRHSLKTCFEGPTYSTVFLWPPSHVFDSGSSSDCSEPSVLLLYQTAYMQFKGSRTRTATPIVSVLFMCSFTVFWKQWFTVALIKDEFYQENCRLAHLEVTTASQTLNLASGKGHLSGCQWQAAGNTLLFWPQSFIRFQTA